MGVVFVKEPGDIPEIFKIVLDTSLLNSRHYQFLFNGKVEQSKERINVLPDSSL